MASPTLRGRVSLLGVAVIGGWLFLVAAGFAAVLSLRLDQQLDDALTVRAQAAAATVEITDGRITEVGEASTDAALDTGIWVFEGARAVERPRAGASLQSWAAAFASAPKAFSDRGGYRFRVLPLRADGRRIGSVVAALDREPYERTRTTAVLGAVTIAVLLLAGIYPALRYVVGRALRPVDAMARQAAEWGTSEPGRRFGEGQRFAELRSLAADLDALLGRLGASLRHERHLSAELSHELRTPLARMRMQLDLLDAPPGLDDDVAALRAHCAAMERIIESLLTAARADLGGAGGRSALSPVLMDVAAGAADGPPVTVEPTGLVVGVDADVVERILAPLRDNAVRHARSRVVLRARTAPDGVVVEVENDGPPVPPDDADRIFEPGHRGDDGRGGAGLGLALARRLARSADGDVVVRAGVSPTVFAVTLPSG
ncbi:sensor histidine kinase [Jatrophihabitans fulvus]